MPVRRGFEALFTGLLTALFVTAYVVAADWPREARLFPQVLAGAMAVLSLVHVLRLLLGSAQHADTPSPAAEGDVAISVDVQRQRTVQIMGWTIGFALLLWVLGFMITVPLMAVAYLRFGAKERWGITLTVAAGAGLAFYLLFIRFLHLPFPAGLLIGPAAL